MALTISSEMNEASLSKADLLAAQMLAWAIMDAVMKAENSETAFGRILDAMAALEGGGFAASLLADAGIDGAAGPLADMLAMPGLAEAFEKTEIDLSGGLPQAKGPEKDASGTGKDGPDLPDQSEYFDDDDAIDDIIGPVELDDMTEFLRTMFRADRGLDEEDLSDELADLFIELQKSWNESFGEGRRDPGSQDDDDNGDDDASGSDQIPADNPDGGGAPIKPLEKDPNGGTTQPDPDDPDGAKGDVPETDPNEGTTQPDPVNAFVFYPVELPTAFDDLGELTQPDPTNSGDDVPTDPPAEGPDTTFPMPDDDPLF